MSKLSAWDLDGTIRPGFLLGEAILFGIAEGFIDPTRYADPAAPTYADADTFLEDITKRSRGDFIRLMTTLSDNAKTQTYPWALERLDEQARTGTVVVLSHSPDFLVSAFCRGLGITLANGSYFHTRQHIFSGHAVLLDKQRALARHMRRQSLLQLDFAAGDTMSDLPILRKAKHAAVVNPAEDLAYIAEQNNWEIIRTA